MPINILVVDDLIEMRTLVRIILARHGWDVLEAEDGVQALKIIYHKKPDLVLMDYDMPDITGIEVCQRVNDDPEIAHIPIIIYTGNSTPGVSEAAYQAGAKAFLLKPLPALQLREHIRKLLDQKQRNTA